MSTVTSEKKQGIVVYRQRVLQTVTSPSALCFTTREFTQRRRRRVRKRHLKSEFALPQTLSRLFNLDNSSNVGKLFWS